MISLPRRQPFKEKTCANFPQRKSKHTPKKKEREFFFFKVSRGRNPLECEVNIGFNSLPLSFSSLLVCLSPQRKKTEEGKKRDRNIKGGGRKRLFLFSSSITKKKRGEERKKFLFFYSSHHCCCFHSRATRSMTSAPPAEPPPALFPPLLPPPPPFPPPRTLPSASSMDCIDSSPDSALPI